MPADDPRSPQTQPPAVSHLSAVEDNDFNGETVALKEWGAAIHAMIDGRQSVLLRKGGIHERAFTPPSAGGGFLLFPTVAHSHAERTRPEHRDLLARGAADVAEDAVTIRCGAEVAGVVEVTQPEALPQIADLHIWTDDSIRTDRIEFRPKKPLHVLIVNPVILDRPRTLHRRDSYGGCKSWVDVATEWNGSGHRVFSPQRIGRDLAHVVSFVGRLVTPAPQA